MSPRDRKERIARFEVECRSRGIPVTVQRRAVLEELLGSREHPTAESILTRVEKRVPGLSLTTVYRVLDLLVDLGLARKTCSPGSACRYDPRIHRHHHLVCLACDRIEDLEDSVLNGLPLPGPRQTSFEIVDYSVHFRGLCARCRPKKRKPSSRSTRARARSGKEKRKP